MALEKAEVARFAVIDMSAPANAYYKITEVINDTGQDPPVQVGAVMTRNEAASLQDISTLLEAFDATVIDANAALNTQNTDLQAQVDDLTTRLANAVSALQAVAVADSSWDNSPRAEVIAVLEAEA